MAYSLQVKLPNDNFKSLDISRSNMFDIAWIFEEYNNIKHCKINSSSYEFQVNHDKIKYSLKMLDRFTMQFDNEIELKLHLIALGILPYELINNPLVIRYISTRKERKHYSLLFLDDYSYFSESDYLINLVENRYLNGDFKFLRDFANYFRNFNECGTTASELYALSLEAIQYKTINRGFNEIDANGDNIVRRLVKLLIYKKDKNKEINWRCLHLLVEFIKDYEEKERNTVLASKNKVSSTKPLTKVRKPNDDNSNELDGQLSFNDLF